MRALISGQAGFGILVSGSVGEIRFVDREPCTNRPVSELIRMMADRADAVEVLVDSQDDLDRNIKLAWAKDRALKLMLLFLARDELYEDRKKYAECLNELLEEEGVDKFLLSRLTKDVLPTAAFSSITDFSFVHDESPLFRIIVFILDSQSLIKRVSDHYDALKPSVFDSPQEKAKFRKVLVDEGAFLNVVEHLRDEKKVDFLRLSLANSHLSHANIIAQWLGPLQPGIQRLPRSLRHLSEVEADVMDRPTFVEDKRHSADSYNYVRDKISSITNKIRNGHISQAEESIDDLLKHQHSHSTSQQMAKTLCNLAQQAKMCEVYPLQLSLAQLSTQVNPEDPITFGHLADAWLMSGRVIEAEAAASIVERLGGKAFAENVRARILRQQGFLDVARQRYKTIAEEFAGTDEAMYASFGAAEILRDLGNPLGALEEYHKLSVEFPLETQSWMGKAGALKDLGRFSEALVAYGMGPVDPSGVSACGQANTLINLGRLEEADVLYSEVLAQYPFNSAALCGKADVLRLRGKFDLALSSYDFAMSRSPYSNKALLGKARLLTEMFRFKESLSLYEAGLRTNSRDVRLHVGIAVVMVKMGNLVEGLSAYARINSEFPFSSDAKIGQADCLWRLGKVEEAIKSYEEIIASRPHLSDATIGLGAALLKKSDYAAFYKLNLKSDPITRFDWRAYVLICQSLVLQREFVSASSLVDKGLAVCPFASIRKSLRNMLIICQIRRRDFPAALKSLSKFSTEVSNIVSFQAYAASKRLKEARRTFRSIEASEAPSEVVSLAREIARRHKVIQGRALHEDEWVFQQQSELVLRAA